MTDAKEETMKTLSEWASKHAAAADAVEIARDGRDKAIRAAAEAGNARTEIAKAARVSREMVYRVLGALVAVVAIFTLSACGGGEPATSPTADQTTVAGTPVVGMTDEPAETVSAEVTEDCWTDPTNAWRDEYNSAGTDPTRALAIVEALPEPAEGCTPADVQSLEQAEALAQRIRDSQTITE